MHQHSVLEACEWLLDELHAEANVANHAGAAALAAGNYAGAHEAMALGEGLSVLREDVVKVMERLKGLLPEQPPPAPQPKVIKERPAQPGQRTHQTEFRIPILQALVALGGSAPMQAVLAHVQRQIGQTLTPLDRQPLPSNSDSIRWTNTTQWCRLTLKHEGLLRGDSAWGVWEISEAGRRWLEEQERGQ